MILVWTWRMGISRQQIIKETIVPHLPDTEPRKTFRISGYM